MKNEWYKLFGSTNFSYFKNSTLVKKEKNNLSFSYKLAKIIYPEINLKKYQKILKFIEKKISLKQNTSILDFGSGNGCFLYYFINKYKLKNNYSFEISKSLIKFQKNKIKFTKFNKTNPYKFNFSKKKINQVDYSICLSCFQYFNSNYYASKVVNFLLSVTKKTILIYDIKNLNLINKHKKKVRLRQGLTKIDFDTKYKNYPLRYYKKTFFIKILDKMVKNKKIKYYFDKLPHSATDYEYGYCLVITKEK
tara:strand:- start:3294 stop:4043 length:750 start_codon:yes stop_codon:yes gene_type:complete